MIPSANADGTDRPEVRQTRLPIGGTIVLSFAHRFQDIFSGQSQEDLWLKSENARTPRARVIRRTDRSIAVLRVKAPVTRSNSIVIAVTKSARAISRTLECGGLTWRKLLTCVSCDQTQINNLRYVKPPHSKTISVAWQSSPRGVRPLPGRVFQPAASAPARFSHHPSLDS